MTMVVCPEWMQRLFRQTDILSASPIITETGTQSCSRQLTVGSIAKSAGGMLTRSHACTLARTHSFTHSCPRFWHRKALHGRPAQGKVWTRYFVAFFLELLSYANSSVCRYTHTHTYMTHTHTGPWETGLTLLCGDESLTAPMLHSKRPLFLPSRGRPGETETSEGGREEKIKVPMFLPRTPPCSLVVVHQRHETCIFIQPSCEKWNYFSHMMWAQRSFPVLKSLCVSPCSPEWKTCLSIKRPNTMKGHNAGRKKGLTFKGSGLLEKQHEVLAE